MASNPVSHVQDIPYLGIAEDFSIQFPKLEMHDGHWMIAWDKPLLGGETFPVLFTVHGFSLLVVAVLLLYGTLSAVKGITTRPDKGRGVSSQLFEVLVSFIRNDVAKPTMGPYATKYLPLVLTFFFFVLFSNLLGMVPILITKAPTSNINVTLCLALIVLGSMFVLGIKEQGMGHFIQNLVPSGLPKWILVLMYPIELVGPLTKSFALCVRLFANMCAGHIILAAFSGLAMSSDGGSYSYNYIALVPAWGMSVAISILEVFVAFLQAYVFTMLSAMFIGSFVHPDH